MLCSTLAKARQCELQVSVNCSSEILRMSPLFSLAVGVLPTVRCIQGNDSPVLPFDASKVRSVAVIGPNGDQPQCGDYAAGGSWGTIGLFLI